MLSSKTTDEGRDLTYDRMSNRRTFLKSIGMVTAGTRLLGSSSVWAEKADAGWRRFGITTHVEIPNSAGTTRVWVPTPLMRDTPFQRLIGTRVQCQRGHWTTVDETQRSLSMVSAEFPPGVTPNLTVVSSVEVRDWAVDLKGPETAPRLSTEERHSWLRATLYVPTDGLVREKASQITRAASTDEARARAIYNWITTETYRKASVRGCGNGEIRGLLASGDLGGKCADLNGLFVGLARAAGLPARDVYGMRVAPSRLGYKSLGPPTPRVTKAQHCRAEVWLEGFGWVPVDPADVRKVMLEEPPGDLPTVSTQVAAARDRLFGSWEMNWVALNYAQDVKLPGSSGLALPFFMYPQAETAAGRLDSLDPEAFRYEITAREVVPGTG